MNNLPKRYKSDGVHNLGYRPISDLKYWIVSHGPGARFAGNGVQVNANQARQRLEHDGLWNTCLEIMEGKKGE